MKKKKWTSKWGKKIQAAGYNNGARTVNLMIAVSQQMI